MPTETLSPLKASVDRRRHQTLLSLQLQLPTGSSALQVRPLPAQPLRKHTKTNQVPSQESMSSFQHVIQFHHWRPETDRPEREQTSVSSTLSRGLVSHKRHKSNEMSIDILVPQEYARAAVKREKNEDVRQKQESERTEDISMDEVTITEKLEPAPSRFPHDILLENT